MAVKVRYLSEKQLANTINVWKRRCRIGKVIPKPVAAGRYAFRRALIDAFALPEDRFERRYVSVVVV